MHCASCLFSGSPVTSSSTQFVISHDSKLLVVNFRVIGSIPYTGICAVHMHVAVLLKFILLSFFYCVLYSECPLSEVLLAPLANSLVIVLVNEPLDLPKYE